MRQTQRCSHAWSSHQCADTVGSLRGTSQPPAFPLHRHLLRCPDSLVPHPTRSYTLKPQAQSVRHVKSELSLLCGRLEAQNPTLLLSSHSRMLRSCKDLLMPLPSSPSGVGCLSWYFSLASPPWCPAEPNASCFKSDSLGSECIHCLSGC